MASIITATTTGGLTQSADNSGVLQLASGTGNLVTVPSVTGTMLTNKSAGSVLQVVQATKTDAVGLSCTSTWTAIPGQGGSGTFSATITPSSSSNKILVFVDLHAAASSGQVTRAQLQRNGTAIYIGDAAGSRPLGFGQLYPNSGTVEIGSMSVKYLDSPATTSAVTYSLYAGTDNTSGVAYINQCQRDNNGTGYDTRTASAIILMEIAA
jgi:hypothetical protein